MGKKHKEVDQYEEIRQMEIQEAILDGKISEEVGHQLMESNYTVAEYLLGIAYNIGKEKPKKETAKDTFNNYFEYGDNHPDKKKKKKEKGGQQMSFAALVGDRPDDSDAVVRSEYNPLDILEPEDYDDYYEEEESSYEEDAVEPTVDPDVPVDLPVQKDVTPKMKPQMPFTFNADDDDEEELEDESDDEDIYPVGITTDYLEDVNKFTVEDEWYPTVVCPEWAMETNKLDQRALDTMDADHLEDLMGELYDYIVMHKHPTAIYTEEEFIKKFAFVREIDHNKYKFFCQDGFIHCYVVEESFYSGFYSLGRDILHLSEKDLASYISLIMGVADAVATVHNSFHNLNKNAVIDFKAALDDDDSNPNESFLAMIKNEDDDVVKMREPGEVATTKDIALVFNMTQIDSFEQRMSETILDLRALDPEEDEDDDDQEEIPDVVVSDPHTSFADVLHEEIDVDEEDMYVPHHADPEEFVGKVDAPELEVEVREEVEEEYPSVEDLEDDVLENHLSEESNKALDTVLKSFHLDTAQNVSAPAPEIPVKQPSVSSVEAVPPSMAAKIQPDQKETGNSYGIERLSHDDSEDMKVSPIKG